MHDHRLRLVLFPELFAIGRFAKTAPMPVIPLSSTFLTITQTADELSIVCQQDSIPDCDRIEPGWRCLRVAGTIDFATTGVLASLVAPLADAKIGVFVVSTFDTDYLLVKERDLKSALTALQFAGHEVVEEFE